MKYIITERQSKLLNEIRIGLGEYESYSQGYLFSTFLADPSVSYEEIFKKTKKYLSSVVGLDVSKLTNDEIYEYVKSLRFKPSGGKRNNKLYSIGIISGLSYYLATKLRKMKSSYGLTYFTEKVGSFVTYWFFDPENEDFVGRILVEINDIYPNSANINLSEIDKPLIGKGYGNKMYLTLINIYTYLMSDKILYKASLNIWVNVLPRYCNVWAKISGKNEYFKITKDELIDPKFADYYVASKEDTIE